MRTYDLIEKKKIGQALTREEIRFLVMGYTNGEIPDYQMAAFLMAVCLKGMCDEELAALTDTMAHSGDMVDLSGISGLKVDKHSTGGVGDKTTLIVAPIVAACGGVVAKMSGRGLGHTGGTLDKLEAIPGMKVSLSFDEFSRVVNEIGMSVIGQTGNITPADKKIYALRDVTATVDSIPLIASSIMSKKLAAGSDCIVLDVKTGSGAFMKTRDEAILLAEKMTTIGTLAGKKTVALITDMDIPLGNAIGNALEVEEAIQTLRGEGPEDLTEVCIQLAANMLFLIEKGTLEVCKELAHKAIIEGKALEKFQLWIKAQGGEPNIIHNKDLLPKASFKFEVKACTEGYIAHMNTEGCGIASMLLGAGRETKDSLIDYSAGIILNKKTGDYVKEGEVLATLFSCKDNKFIAAKEKLLASYHFSSKRPKIEPLILARVEHKLVERYE